MNRTEILELCKKYYIASGKGAVRIAGGESCIIVRPALIGFENEDVTYIRSETDGVLSVSFFGKEGYNLTSVSSEYAEGDYIYVREAYWKENGKVRYFSDFVPGDSFIRNKVIAGRFMPKATARLFLKVKKVGLRRLKCFGFDEIHKYGFNNFEEFFAEYDSALSEREYEFSSSKDNPYVFVYVCERIQ